MKTVRILIFFELLVFLFALGSNSFAYASDQGPNLPVPSLINPLDYLKEDLLKGAAQSTGIGTTIPDLNLLNTKNFSSGDVVSMLKAVAVLAINLFLIVIQTVAGILKALLPFLSK